MVAIASASPLSAASKNLSRRSAFQSGSAERGLGRFSGGSIGASKLCAASDSRESVRSEESEAECDWNIKCSYGLTCGRAEPIFQALLRCQLHFSVFLASFYRAEPPRSLDFEFLSLLFFFFS